MVIDDMILKVVILAVPIYFADVIGPLDQATQTFLTQGVLGSLCVILMFAVYRLFTALQASHLARVEDAKKLGEILAKNSEASAILAENVAGLARVVQANQQALSRVRT